MEKLEFSIVIKSDPETIWAAIISDKKYRFWCAEFHEGSYFEGGWKKGDSIKFLVKNENGTTSGMLSEIASNDHLRFLSLHHLGLINEGNVDYDSDMAKKWTPSYENYYLEKQSDSQTLFRVSVDVHEEFLDFFKSAWDKALQALKDLCEQDLVPFGRIEIETLVDSSIEHAWKVWTTPEDIKEWAFASDDWHCPQATNDLRVGGRFVTTMASKDGKMAFDFSGTYTKVEQPFRLSSQLDDGRMVWVTFEAIAPGTTRIVEIFETEDENSLEQQRIGWQAILNNYKRAANAERK